MSILTETTKRVCAVIVVFYPDDQVLQRLITLIKCQVTQIVVVDNGSTGATKAMLEELVERGTISTLPQLHNVGVAAAHNAGIAWADSTACSHVLLLDQDSEPSEGMVQSLLKAEMELLEHGEKVAAVGPRFFDPRTGIQAPFIELRGWKIAKKYCASVCNRPIRADYLISSGSLIRLKVLRVLGNMDSTLFIDYVDIEWGLRAKALGNFCFGVCQARMQHHLGDRPIRVPLTAKMISSHSPLRHYYVFRNAVILYRRKYVSRKWVINDACRLALKFIAYSVLLANPIQHFKMMTLGIWHALIGRTGNLS